MDCQFRASCRPLVSGSLLAAFGAVVWSAALVFTGVAAGADESRPEVVDLLSIIDAGQDAFVGVWEKRDGRLLCNVEKAARLEVPYALPAQYELSLAITRSGNGTVNVGLVYGGRLGNVIIQDQLVGLGNIDGRRAVDNVTTNRQFRWTDRAQARDVTIRVETGRVTVLVDGQKVVDYQGGPDRMNSQTDWRTPNKGLLVIGSNRSAMVVSRMELRSIDGAPLPVVDTSAYRKPGSWLARREAKPAPTAVKIRTTARVEAFEFDAIKTNPAQLPYLSGGTLVARLPTVIPPSRLNGQIDLRVEQSGPVFLAAHWNDEANESLLKNHSAPVDLCRMGWMVLEKTPLINPATRAVEDYLIFFRQAAAGESFILRTGRLYPPLVIVPPSGRTFDVADFEYPVDANEYLQRDFLASKAWSMLGQRQFAELDRWIGQLANDGTKHPSGQFMLHDAYRGLSGWIHDAKSPEWQRQLDLAEAWLAERPDSVAARIALAFTLLHLADVTRNAEGGRELFDERIDRAVDLFAEAEQQDARHTPLTGGYFYAARLQRWPADLVDRILRDSLRLRAWDPSSLRVAANYYMPLYFGAEAETDVVAMAAEAADLTAAELGDSLYAVVAHAAQARFGPDAYNKFQFDWDRVERGYRDWLKRHPESDVVVQEFCQWACRLQRRDTAQELFRRIGDRPLLPIWTSRFWFEVRRNWAHDDYFQGEQQSVVNLGHQPALTFDWVPGKQRLAAGAYDYRLHFFDLATQRHSVSNADFQNVPRRVAVGLDGCLVVVVDRTGQLRVCDREADWKHELLGEPHQQHQSAVYGMAVSPSRDVLATGSNDGVLKLWDLRQLRLVATTLAQADKKGVRGIAFLPGGRSVATVGGDGLIRVHEADTGKVTSQWAPEPAAALTQVAVSPDGKHLATGAADGQIVLWDLPGQKPIARWQADAPVNGLDFSPDGQWLAAGGGELNRVEATDVWLCRLDDPDAPRRLRGHRASIAGVRFSPDGGSLATSSIDLSIRLWDIPPADSP